MTFLLDKAIISDSNYVVVSHLGVFVTLSGFNPTGLHGFQGKKGAYFGMILGKTL